MKKILIVLLCLGLLGCRYNNEVRVVDQNPIKEKILSTKRIPTKVFLDDQINQDPITISFVGDIMMDWSVKEAMEEFGVDYPFLEVKEEIMKADIAVANVETAITIDGVEFPKQYNFRSNPESVRGLKNAGFDLVSLANNHTMDYGIEGLLDTLSYLKKNNLKYMGAGIDKDEAFSAIEFRVKGREIKFLAFSRVLPDVSWYSENQKPGIASAYQENEVLQTIEKEKKQTDFLFIYIHWGTEKAIYPNKEQQKYAYKMIDAGADGVIGSHPHVLQGFEFYQQKPIAYSLGNFLFPDYVRDKSAETGIYTLTIEQDDIKMNFSPYYIENNQIIKKDHLYVKQQMDYLLSISSIESVKGNQIVKK